MKPVLVIIFLLSSIIFQAQNKSEIKNDSIYNNFIPIKLAEISFRKKAISQLGFAKTTRTSHSFGTRDTNTILAITYSTNRWWINKYFAGGWFYDMSPNKNGGYAIGPQLTGFAEFDEFILPYITFASGFGYNVVEPKKNSLIKSKVYIPYILKIGGYIFFKKNRGFALFTEVNMHLNEEIWPMYRVGIAWSKLKR